MKCRSPQSRIQFKRGGAALLMVLGMVTIAALICGRVALTSIKTATLANEAEQLIRQRWAHQSIANVLILHGNELLVDSPNATETFRIKLNDQSTTVVVSDENQKVNLNSLLKFERNSELRHFLADEAGAVGLHVREDFPSDGLTSIESWGQVFDLDRTGAGNSLVKVTQSLTLWGSGQMPKRRDRSTTFRNLTAYFGDSEVRNPVFSSQDAPQCFSVWIIEDRRSMEIDFVVVERFQRELTVSRIRL